MLHALTPRLFTAGLLLASLATTGRAQHDYYNVPLDSLELTLDEQLTPDQPGELVDWRLQRQQRVRLVLEEGGEAYLDLSDRGGWALPLNRLLGAQLAARVPRGAQVRGRLFAPREDRTGMQAWRFSLPRASEDPAAHEHFNRLKYAHYRDLLRQGIPGAAWFRHRMEEARRALEGENYSQLQLEPARPRRPGRSELEDTFEVFTGGRALAENLQLDRTLAILPEDENKVAISSIAGVEVKELDWTERNAGLDPELDPLAKWIPADQHAIFFPSFDALVAVLDEATAYGTPVLQALDPRVEDARVRERYEQQLCVELDDLTRLLGSTVIRSVAITGSDPYLRTGSDLALLFESNDPETLHAFLRARQNAALERVKALRPAGVDVSLSSGLISGVPYSMLRSTDNRLRSYAGRIQDLVVLTNSPRQLAAIGRVAEGRADNLAGNPEYVFFRDRYARGDAVEAAFVVLTDATIRRWGGPHWRIGASRRTRAAAVMSELQARAMPTLLTGEIEPGPMERPDDLPAVGALRSDVHGISSERFGTTEFLTPIAELPIEMVSEAERDAYARFRNRYQNNWREYFDPIAGRLELDDGRLALDLSVMPLIRGSDYRELIDITSGVALRPGAGDPHAESLLHWAVAVNRESSTFKSYASFLGGMGFGPDPFRWVGEAVAVYVDKDPFWAEWSEAEETENFLSKNFGRLPLAAFIEVRDPLALAAFLTALRGFSNQTAPDLTVWETRKHRERSYVRIAPTSAAGIRGETEWAIYYAALSDGLTVTLHEGVVQRAIGRHLDRAAQPDAERKPWPGRSVSLSAEQGVVELLRLAWRESLHEEMRKRSWQNLTILNEWRRLYPDRDPVEVHQAVWTTRPVCPSGSPYVWNEAWQTMESNAFGHPGAPKTGPTLPQALADTLRGEFGLEFELDGLRARAVLERESGR